MTATNYASLEFNSRIHSFSSSILDCFPENLLDSNLNNLWLTSPDETLPQWLCISLNDVEQKQDIVIRTIGWHCWHPYKTNPKKVLLHVSPDGENFKLWDTFEANSHKGTQLFCCAPIRIKIFPFIALEVVQNFGGNQTYMNRIYFYSDEILSSPYQSIDSNLHFLNHNPQIYNSIEKSKILNQINSNEDFSQYDESKCIDSDELLRSLDDSLAGDYVSCINSTTESCFPIDDLESPSVDSVCSITYNSLNGSTDNSKDTTKSEEPLLTKNTNDYNDDATEILLHNKVEISNNKKQIIKDQQEISSNTVHEDKKQHEKMCLIKELQLIEIMKYLHGESYNKKYVSKSMIKECKRLYRCVLLKNIKIKLLEKQYNSISLT